MSRTIRATPEQELRDMIGAVLTRIGSADDLQYIYAITLECVSDTGTMTMQSLQESEDNHVEELTRPRRAKA